MASANSSGSAADSPACNPDIGSPRRLAETLREAGLGGPVLIVAGDDAVSLLAPAWAESFAAAGWTHRVLAGGGGEPSREIASIAAEAESLAAAVIVGVGSDHLLAACRAAAATRRLPFVACPCGSSREARPWRTRPQDG